LVLVTPPDFGTITVVSMVTSESFARFLPAGTRHDSNTGNQALAPDGIVG